MKRIKIVFIAIILAVVMIFGVAGCNAGTQNELQGKIAEMENQIRERDEKIEQLEKELRALQNKDWRAMTDMSTFIVGVNENKLGHSLKAADLVEVNVTRIIPIDGVFAQNRPVSLFDIISFYSVKTEDSSDETLELIKNFEFVDSVWRNSYDYSSNPVPSEEKYELNTKEHWERFSGYIFVGIDRSYRDRLFTAEDFKISGLVSVEWLTYTGYSNATDHMLYYIEISSTTDTAVNTALEELYRLDFVRSVSPACDGKDTDTTGYPG